MNNKNSNNSKLQKTFKHLFNYDTVAMNYLNIQHSITGRRSACDCKQACPLCLRSHHGPCAHRGLQHVLLHR